ncbi:hypothetical protein D3C81_1862040 [compost metagenome]
MHCKLLQELRHFLFLLGFFKRGTHEYAYLSTHMDITVYHFVFSRFDRFKSSDNEVFTNLCDIGFDILFKTLITDIGCVECFDVFRAYIVNMLRDIFCKFLEEFVFRHKVSLCIDLCHSRFGEVIVEFDRDCTLCGDTVTLLTCA